MEKMSADCTRNYSAPETLVSLIGEEGLEGTRRDDGDGLKGLEREEILVPGDEVVRARHHSTGEDPVIGGVAAHPPAERSDRRDHGADGKERYRTPIENQPVYAARTRTWASISSPAVRRIIRRS